MNTPRFDLLYRLQQLMAYLQEQSFGFPVYAGIVPQSQGFPFVRVSAGESEINQSSLDFTDAPQNCDWVFTVVAENGTSADAIVAALWAALNRPGERFNLGVLRVHNCRVVSDGFEFMQLREASELSVLVYEMKVRIKV